MVALGVLEGRWKAIKARGGGSSYAPACSATASGRHDLLHRGRIPRHGRMAGHQPQLLATPGVEELDRGGTSARGARVTLRYPGGAEQLAAALVRPRSGSSAMGPTG